VACAPFDIDVPIVGKKHDAAGGGKAVVERVLKARSQVVAPDVGEAAVV